VWAKQANQTRHAGRHIHCRTNLVKNHQSIRIITNFKVMFFCGLAHELQREVDHLLHRQVPPFSPGYFITDLA
jgi:hypothetical protein